jgi:hypothetical protein
VLYFGLDEASDFLMYTTFMNSRSMSHALYLKEQLVNSFDFLANLSFGLTCPDLVPESQK